MAKTRTALLLAAAALTAAAEARAQISVVGNQVMETQARPGERYSGVIVLRNDTAEPQEAKVYQTDYESHANGTTIYGQPGSGRRSNARWISFSPSHVKIPGGQRAEVRYTAAVPPSGAAELTGSYWSMIMVEGIPRGSAESARSVPGAKKVQVAVVSRIRYAVQLVTHIGGGGPGKVQFAEAKVLADKSGRKTLQFDLVNTGERAYHPAISVEVYSESGKQVRALKQVREITYPGSSLRQSFDLAVLPSGTYKALVVVDAGGSDVFGAQLKLKF
jgi:hypothetical protein